MPADKGLKIASVQSGGIAEQSGLLPGDIIVAVNKRRIRDIVDFLFYCDETELMIDIRRDRTNIRVPLSFDDVEQLGIDFESFKVMTCKNKCIFCFVKQLPKQLRKTLYVKDEDYRLSFLYGNYITLSNMSMEDKKRIVKQRLSPLYISVHTTNRVLRNRMIGNPNAPDILKELKFFADNKIRFHAQVVLCPGYNDGKELQLTLNSLLRYYPYLLSVAVVPVGITSHSTLPLTPVEKEDAVNALRTIEAFQKRMIKKHGIPVAFGSDELYLKAERSFPSIKEYGDFPQLENGVGMVPLFLYQAKKIILSTIPYQKASVLTFTGVSFYPFLKKFADRISRETGILLDVIPVENRFFGPSVTVTGLLTGRDIINRLLDISLKHDLLAIPDVVLNEDALFLDDITLKNIEEEVGIPVKKISSTPQGLLDVLTGIL